MAAEFVVAMDGNTTSITNVKVTLRRECGGAFHDLKRQSLLVLLSG